MVIRAVCRQFSRRSESLGRGIYLCPVDAQLLPQVVLGGLAQGAVLGLVALGFSLVAGTVRVLHFAHGDITVAAIFVGVLTVLGRTPIAAVLDPAAAALFVIVIVIAGAFLSGLVGRFVVLPNLTNVPDRHRHHGDVLGWIAGGLAAGLLLRETLGLLFSQQAYAIPDPFRLDRLVAGGLIRLPGGSTVPVRAVLVFVIGLGVGLLAEQVLVRSRVGRSMRAVADDPEGAALCGVSARRVVMWAFVVAGVLAGVAAVLAAPGRAISVDDGAVLGLEASAVALLAGVGSLRGALGGGLVVGVVQALVVYAFGPGWYDIAPLVLLVGLLAVRRQGIPLRAS
jgi:branched-chain amino acid transport system permease protein